MSQSPHNSSDEQNLSGMSVMIAGGAGFIGTHLARRLAGRGAGVTILDPAADSLPGDLTSPGGRIEPIAGAAGSPDRLEELLRTSDLVIDCIGAALPGRGIDDPGLDCESNYRAHLPLIAALREHATPVIYIGSRSQYGRVEGVVDEDCPQRPLDPQGVHKSAAESMYRIYASQAGFGCASLRLGNCYGPGQPLDKNNPGLIGSFIRDLLGDGKLVLYGGRTRSRHLLYVEDLARTVGELAPMVARFDGFRAFNLAGCEHTLESIASTLVRLLGRGEYAWETMPGELKEIEPGEARFSHEAIERLLGARQWTPLEVALKRTLDYYLAQV